MNTEFTFNEVTIEQVKLFESMSHIFNNTKGYIEKEKVVLCSFEDDRLGDSIEKLDIAVYNLGEWKVLDISDKIEGYNEIPLGYVLQGVEYERVMVIIRRLSSMVLDVKKEGVSAYIYNVISDKLSSIESDKYSTEYGILCRNDIILDLSDTMLDKINSLNDRDKGLILAWYDKEVDSNDGE